MTSQRFSIWLQQLQDRLVDQGQSPISEDLARALYEEGDNPEETARYLASRAAKQQQIAVQGMIRLRTKEAE